MTKQNLQAAFDDLRDNNDKGHRAYRVAEFLAPQIGTVAPVDDTDIALFIGAEYVNTTTGTKYYATAVTLTTTTWTAYAVV